jgi:hypothetical protein
MRAGRSGSFFAQVVLLLLTAAVAVVLYDR